MSERAVLAARALLAKLPELHSYAISDGSGGGEPDYIWLGWVGPRDHTGHCRYVEVGDYSDDSAFEVMNTILKLVRLVPALVKDE